MFAMNIRVDGKRTLVTGDNFGIGAAIALGLAAAGAMWRSTTSSIPKPHLEK